MALHILLSAPRIFKSIRSEHKLLRKLIRERKIDTVISDNRYGLWSREAYCIFITHQVFIQAPVFAGVLHKLTARYMSRFSECWIPDLNTKENLSGDLAHKEKLPQNCFFIGPLSRFGFSGQVEGGRYDLVIALSGPEPQRSVFEKKILSQLPGIPGRILLLQGITEKNGLITEGNLTVVSHLPAEEMKQALSGTAIWIGRSGYSSIMDAAALGKKCIFVPTPGQTEQVYLAQFHERLGHCIVMNQKRFNLEEALGKMKMIRGFEKKKGSDEMLKERLENLLNR